MHKPRRSCTTPVTNYFTPLSLVIGRRPVTRFCPHLSHHNRTTARPIGGSLDGRIFWLLSCYLRLVELDSYFDLGFSHIPNPAALYRTIPTDARQPWKRALQLLFVFASSLRNSYHALLCWRPNFSLSMLMGKRSNINARERPFR